MQVLFVATEVAPWLKVGGLGDVVGSLPASLRQRGLDVRVIVPGHGDIHAIASDARKIARYSIAHQDTTYTADIFETRQGDVPLYFVMGSPIPKHGVIYTGRGDEEGFRFTFFSLAVLEFVADLQPDVMHAHDWHTCAAVWELAERRPSHPRLSQVSSLLTIHNLPYSGMSAVSAMESFGVRGRLNTNLGQSLSFCPLGMGLVSADHVSTVSAGYAREILDHTFGCGFEDLLRHRGPQVSGILNGLDQDVWNPETDAELSVQYGSGTFVRRIQNRDALLREVNLSLSPQTPLFAVVSRLVDQKGIDLIVEAVEQLREHLFGLVVLGTGDPSLEMALTSLAAKYPDRVAAEIRFDGAFARRIYAGADFMLMPSRYEPCGMTQMIAMRYGCVPVARETGGLADTVMDWDLSDEPNGILFADATSSALTFAMRRAISLFAKPDELTRLRRHGMACDFSWAQAASAYEELYSALRNNHAQGKI